MFDTWGTSIKNNSLCLASVNVNVFSYECTGFRVRFIRRFSLDLLNECIRIKKRWLIYNFWRYAQFSFIHVTICGIIRQ